VGASAACLEEGWVQGVLLPKLPKLNIPQLISWLTLCQGTGGLGFGKDDEAESDPFHTCYALAGLSLAYSRTHGPEEKLPLQRIDPALGLILARLSQIRSNDRFVETR